MSDPQVSQDQIVRNHSSNRPKKRLVIFAVGAVLVIGALFGLARFYTRDRDDKKESIVISEPSLKPDEFVAAEKQAVAKSTASEIEKIEQLTAAANYYTNLYDYNKVRNELDLVAKNLPAAEENHFYLVSYFTALQYLNETALLKTYAQKILALEQRGIKSTREIPSPLRQAIDENAQ